MFEENDFSIDCFLDMARCVCTLVLKNMFVMNFVCVKSLLHSVFLPVPSTLNFSCNYRVFLKWSSSSSSYNMMGWPSFFMSEVFITSWSCLPPWSAWNEADLPFVFELQSLYSGSSVHFVSFQICHVLSYLCWSVLLTHFWLYLFRHFL